MENVANELYALHPTDFVEARAARVDEALKAGKGKVAARLAALKRPTLSAWAGNLLVQANPRQVTRLLRLGEALRQADHDRATTRLRGLSQQQDILVGVLSRQARTLAAEAGHPIGEAAQRKVEDTMRAALADPAAARKWASGRLVKALVPPAGFAEAAPAGTLALPAPAPRRARGSKTPSRPVHRDVTDAERAEAALHELEERSSELAQQLQATTELRRQVLERATELAQQLHATAELRRRVRNDLDNARTRAAETDLAARQARHAAQTARVQAELLRK